MTDFFANLPVHTDNNNGRPNGYMRIGGGASKKFARRLHKWLVGERRRRACALDRTQLVALQIAGHPLGWAPGKSEENLTKDEENWLRRVAATT